VEYNAGDNLEHHKAGHIKVETRNKFPFNIMRSETCAETGFRTQNSGKSLNEEITK
jgi:hypothetical protein